MGVTGVEVRVDVGWAVGVKVAVAVGCAVAVADGSPGNWLGVTVSGVAASGVTARQAASAKNKAKIPVKMRCIAQLYRLRYHFNFQGGITIASHDPKVEEAVDLDLK